jgi:hypothetical protein
MTTKLSAPFKRELDLNGEKYTVTLTPEGLKLVRKGKRKGVELTWATIVNGDAALAHALNASVGDGRASMPSGTHQTKH